MSEKLTIEDIKRKLEPVYITRHVEGCDYAAIIQQSPNGFTEGDLYQIAEQYIELVEKLEELEDRMQVDTRTSSHYWRNELKNILNNAQE